MATNKPVGDNARKGAVKKRSQLAAKTMGKKTFTKRNKEGGGEVALPPGGFDHGVRSTQRSEQTRTNLSISAGQA
jgi:hypothetical protein